MVPNHVIMINLVQMLEFSVALIHNLQIITYKVTILPFI